MPRDRRALQLLATTYTPLARALLIAAAATSTDAGERICMPNIRIEIAIPVEGATERPITAHVYARATDGWSVRLSYLDAHAVIAFALNPE